MTRSKRMSRLTCLLALILGFILSAPLYAQAPRPVNFLASHYDVSATLDSIGQSLSATAKIDFTATEASSNVRVELQDLLIETGRLRQPAALVQARPQEPSEPGPGGGSGRRRRRRRRGGAARS